MADRLIEDRLANILCGLPRGCLRGEFVQRADQFRSPDSVFAEQVIPRPAAFIENNRSLFVPCSFHILLSLPSTDGCGELTTGLLWIRMASRSHWRKRQTRRLCPGEGICLDFSGTRPEKNCTRFDLEVSRSSSGGEPSGRSCFGRKGWLPNWLRHCWEWKSHIGYA